MMKDSTIGARELLIAKLARADVVEAVVHQPLVVAVLLANRGIGKEEMLGVVLPSVSCRPGHFLHNPHEDRPG